MQILLSSNADQPIVRRCLSDIRESDIYFGPAVRLNTRYVHEISTIRFSHMAEGQPDQEKSNYTTTLGNIDSFEEMEILCSEITASTTGYSIFTSINWDRLLGVVKAYSNMQKAVALRKEYLERGFTVSALLFRNGGRLRSRISGSDGEKESDAV
ncbi:MAG: hypothetical protein ABIR47_10530 [Candidatus Kapaibacterium sp.]